MLAVVPCIYHRAPCPACVLTNMCNPTLTARCGRLRAVHQGPGGTGEHWRRLRQAWHNFCEDQRLLRGRWLWRARVPSSGLLRGRNTQCLRGYTVEPKPYPVTLSLSRLFFAGELSEEEEVLQWLITQKTEDRIELITRQMLETMVEETQYLAVYFCE